MLTAQPYQEGTRVGRQGYRPMEMYCKTRAVPDPGVNMG